MIMIILIIIIIIIIIDIFIVISIIIVIIMTVVISFSLSRGRRGPALARAVRRRVAQQTVNTTTVKVISNLVNYCVISDTCNQ